VGFTFVNGADSEITDATLSMTWQVPGALDEVVVGVEVRSTNHAIDGSSADFGISAAAVTASVPDDGFTVAAGEQVDSTLVLTFEEPEAEVGCQLEAAIVGERDGETVSGVDFDNFTLVAADADPADEDPADEVEQPDRIDAGSGGAATTSGWLPLAMAGLGAACCWAERRRVALAASVDRAGPGFRARRETGQGCTGAPVQRPPLAFDPWRF